MLTQEDDEARDEPEVAVPVHRRRKAHGGGANAAAGEGERRPLGEAAPAGRRGGVRHVVLGREFAGLKTGQAGGDDQRPARAGQSVAERLDGVSVRGG